MFQFFRSKSQRPSASVAAAHGSAPARSDLVDPKVMEGIGNLELLSRTVVDGLLAGKHRSTTKGGCCEFAQHRQYAPGDEIRQIDWQVYARNDRYYIKQFEEETNLHGIVAIDTSGSMKFGVSTVSKLEYARRAAACLARLLLHQRDAVGAVVLNDARPLFVPPRQNAAHLQAILACLQAAEPSGGGSLGAQIRSMIPRLHRRGLFVLFSDCFGDLDDLSRALRALRGRGHDFIVMNVLAPEEIHFRFRRWSSFQSLEVAGHQVNLDPASIRDEYLKELYKHLNRLEEIVTGLGGDYLRMTTNHDLAELLGWYLRGRMARGT
jgi:uncharacterized protein (DUF58 family)